MICPKCKNQNNEQNMACEYCGFKLKMTCPKCKKINKIGQVRCSNCDNELLKVCPKCKALNKINSNECRKCSTPLKKVEIQTAKEKIETPHIAPDLSQDEYAVLSVELINLSTINVKVTNKELLNKIINKFYQTFARIAKINAEKAKKLSANTITIEFKNSTSIEDSTNKALISAYEALIDIQEFNTILFPKLGINIKIKIGIEIVKKGSTSYAKDQRLLARASEIVISPDIIPLAKEEFMFEEAKTQSGELYYKLTELVQHKEENAEPQKEEHEYQAETGIKSYSRSDIFETILKTINDTNEGQVISIHGPDGIGKTSILSNLNNAFEGEPIFWIFGQCHSTYNNVPFAFFKNLFKSLFGLPINNVNVEESKTNILKILSEKIQIDNTEMQNQILSIIFPNKNNLDTHLLINKEKTIQTIQTVLAKICEKSKTVLIIDDFEYIDPASMECFKRILSSGLLTQNIKIILSTKYNKNIQDIINIDTLNQTNTQSIEIGKYTSEEILEFIDGFIGDRSIIPQKLRDQIIKHSHGLPIYVEQVIMLLMQTGAITINPEKEGEFIADEEINDLTIPEDVRDIIKLRLNNIAQVSANAFRVIYYASIMGIKFMPLLLQNILEIPKEEFKEIMELLIINGIFNGYDDFNFVFKNRTIWETAYNLDTNNDNKVACFMSVNQGLLKNTLVDNAIIAENAKKANLTPQYIINFVEQSIQESYSVGDDYSYIALKTEFLSLIDKTEIENKDKIKLYTKEELAKLTYNKTPKEAIKYLSELILIYEKEEQIDKVIDLCGYLAKGCETTGDFIGAIEATDKALSYISKEKMPYEYAMLCYAKMEHLINLGRLEELLVLSVSEVVPAIEHMISNKTKPIGMEEKELQHINVDVMYLMAKAMALQGNKECMQMAEQLSQTANKYDNMNYAIKAQLIAALFKALQGATSDVNAILEAIKEVIPNVPDRVSNFMEWHFINTLNNLIAQDIEPVQKDIGGLINFSMSTGAYFYQPLTKALLGKLFQYENNYSRATDIYYDLIHFCSNNKLATAALTIWYFITESEMNAGNKDKAMAVAQNALDVAQNPAINNAFFQILFKKALAEINLKKAEFDIATSFAQQAIQQAQQNSLLIWEVKLMILSGNILKTSASINTEEKKEKIEKAYKIYLNALERIKIAPNQKIIQEIENNVNELNQICAKEGIKV